MKPYERLYDETDGVYVVEQWLADTIQQVCMLRAVKDWQTVPCYTCNQLVVSVPSLTPHRDF